MTKYPLFKVHTQTAEALVRIKSVLNSGFINEGEQVKQLTQSFQIRMKTKQLILTNSCTSALTLALRLAGVRFCDEVISTPMTCVATNTPIVAVGADIVWADIDPNTGCILASDVALLLEKNPKTAAVMVVAWAGIPPDLKELRTICDKYGTKLILDAAHAMMSSYNDQKIHEFADFTCYSLQAIKHVTTGDGGILICKDPADYARSKKLKWFGIDRDEAKDSFGDWKGQHWDFDIEEAGYKFNMNNLTAAFGMSQMPYVDGLVEGHKYNAITYKQLFHKTKTKFFEPLKAEYECDPAHWVYTVKLDIDKIDRLWLLNALNAEGIAAGLVHVPNHNYTCFKKFYKKLEGVDKFAERQFSLPVGWWLDEADINHIFKRVQALCKQYEKQKQG